MEVLTGILNWCLARFPEPWQQTIVGIIFVIGSASSIFLIIYVTLSIKKRVQVWASNDETRKYRKLCNKYSDLENKYQALNNQFDKLSEVSKKANHIVNYITSVLQGIEKATWEDYHQTFNDRIDRTLRLILSTLKYSLVNGNTHSNRVAIFRPNLSSTGLSIYWQDGSFSIEAEEKLILAIGDNPENPGSIAGKCFLKKEQIYSRDINSDCSFIPNQKSHHTYYSLACTPIMAGDECIGVLSVDDSEEDGFTNRDLEYMRLFAELISLLVAAENKIETNRISFEEVASK